MFCCGNRLDFALHSSGWMKSEGRDRNPSASTERERARDLKLNCCLNTSSLSTKIVSPRFDFPLHLESSWCKEPAPTCDLHHLVMGISSVQLFDFRSQSESYTMIHTDDRDSHRRARTPPKRFDVDPTSRKLGGVNVRQRRPGSPPNTGHHKADHRTTSPRYDVRWSSRPWPAVLIRSACRRSRYALQHRRRSAVRFLTGWPASTRQLHIWPIKHNFWRQCDVRHPSDQWHIDWI